MATQTMTKKVCQNCGHAWESKSEKAPIQCPKCRKNPDRKMIYMEKECNQCGHKWESYSTKVKQCPKCRGSINKIEQHEHFCKRCRNYFTSRSEHPVKCKICHQIPWDKDYLYPYQIKEMN